MLSVLSELCGLNRSAVSLSKSSLQKVDQQNTDIVYSNLGRQLRKLSQHKEAIEIFRQIKETDFPVECDFALTLYLGNNLILIVSKVVLFMTEAQNLNTFSWSL